MREFAGSMRDTPGGEEETGESAAKKGSTGGEPSTTPEEPPPSVVSRVAAAIAVARGFGLGQVAQAVLVLQMIAPVAVTGYLIALRAREAGNPEGGGPDPDAVAGLVVISTLLSVISLPLVLGFLVG